MRTTLRFKTIPECLELRVYGEDKHYSTDQFPIPALAYMLYRSDLGSVHNVEYDILKAPECLLAAFKMNFTQDKLTAYVQRALGGNDRARDILALLSEV